MYARKQLLLLCVLCGLDSEVCFLQHRLVNAGSIGWFTEGQAFLRSYDSAPLLPHSPPPPSVTFLFCLSIPVCRRSNLLTGEGGKGVFKMSQIPNYATGRKPGPL